jgi:hypothetical protein
MVNLGNSGQRGYRMQPISGYEDMGDGKHVSIILACGHRILHEPYLREGESTEHYIADVSPRDIGKQKLRCNLCRPGADGMKRFVEELQNAGNAQWVRYVIGCLQKGWSREQMQHRFSQIKGQCEHQKERYHHESNLNETTLAFFTAVLEYLEREQ